jgi:hypothetical protein
MEYMLDVGKTLQTAAAQNPNLMAAGKINPNSFQRLLEREQTPGTSTPPNEIEDTFDLCESEIGEEQAEDEESGGEDSDDEGLNNRLCTYTVTQKEFMSQHWYHCHSCGMVDGVGVCSICARVCHKGHDVTYAKFGSFFCDCGAKTDATCLALVRRPNISSTENQSNNASTKGTSSTAVCTVPSSYNPFLSESTSAVMNSGQVPENRRASSPTPADLRNIVSTAPGSASSRREGLIRTQGTCKWEELVQTFRAFSEHLPLVTLVKLKTAVSKLASLKTPIGAYVRVQRALDHLRCGNEGQLEFVPSDDLMVSHRSNSCFSSFSVVSSAPNKFFLKNVIKTLL